MNRKALFFDIDGTLLDDRTKTMPESTVWALQKAREAGHLVLINTGRARCLMDVIEESAEVDGFLCGCGTYIEIGGRVAFHHVIPDARRLELQRSILAHRLDGILEGTEVCCMQAGDNVMPQIRQVTEIIYKGGHMIATDWFAAPFAFDKFCAVCDENSDVPGFLASLAPDMTAIDRGHGLYECVPTGFDKATAMRFVLDRFGIPVENSYAFGDSSNDMAMIRFAGHSVIMGKHDEVLEPYASFITKRVEEDGIAYAFERLNII